MKPHQSSSDLLAEIVVYLVVVFAVDAFAAWALMNGLHGLHVKAGFWPCFWIICAISVAARSGSGSKK